MRGFVSGGQTLRQGVRALTGRRVADVASNLAGSYIGRKIIRAQKINPSLRAGTNDMDGITHFEFAGGLNLKTCRSDRHIGISDSP